MDITNQSKQQNNKEVIELLEEQNKLLIEENKSKLQLLKCLWKVIINCKTINLSTEKFQVVKHRKYCKTRTIENKPINCQSGNESLYTDGDGEETENSPDSHTSFYSNIVFIEKKKLSYSVCFINPKLIVFQF